MDDKKNCVKCDMPLDDASKCECAPDKCMHCCEHEECDTCTCSKRKKDAE